MTNPMQNEGSASYGRDEVIKIINSVLSKVEESGADPKEAIHKELVELHQIIENTRSEIGQTKPEDIKGKHIPGATDELDAVVQSTAEATGTIMDCCEVIEEKASAVGGGDGDAIAAEVTKIYEACSFQDITGQRITKVVTSLKVIEEKVEKLLQIWAVPDEVAGGDQESSESGSLLNGPQLPDKAITQDDIDKILAEFD